ncbi:transcription initiation factor IID, TAF10 subunit [Xylona heveae TC161]|uniref:Transcription initiation factor TFIID subunit 10 n=1 Tax=Xylona heveae (strain CBS 132557 / TC161) TaxID=1328760 RepID=A0A164ZTA5_XYLHT|nr:transcription initiation factor IID, TAF10 subunit [Xylona heveae TC161]KZF19484.1 transcription initiation factor IID, TAF10 subunit [Xylona heveae TC161]
MSDANETLASGPGSASTAAPQVNPVSQHSEQNASASSSGSNAMNSEIKKEEGQEEEKDLDASIDADIDMGGTSSQPNAMNMDGAADGDDDVDPVAPAPDPRVPSKKDATLREFLGKMDDYAPIIPDAVTNYYLTKAGLPPPPETSPQLARLLALATQKFIADIAADAYQYSRIRSSNTTSSNPMGGLGATGGFPMPGQAGGASGAQGGKDTAGGQGKSAVLGMQRPGFGGGGQGGGQGRTVLTMEDLGMAVGEYGVNVRRGEFYR